PRAGPLRHFSSPSCSIGRQYTGSGEGPIKLCKKRLLGGLPRLTQGGASSNAAFMDPEAYRERSPH
ncbi:hypothetical protein HAX54_008279, partial [Datura stramonium]|nr:hypothetical protein [Datura stramonium]